MEVSKTMALCVHSAIITGGPLLTRFLRLWKNNSVSRNVVSGGVTKWTNESTYQNKPCYLLNRVVRELCKQKTACSFLHDY